jgi:DNA-directed RNA polymerase sigma subunit (sigma70/sigma32)
MKLDLFLESVAQTSRDWNFPKANPMDYEEGFLDCLSEKEKRVLTSRLEGRTLAGIGREFERSAEEIRRIQQVALLKLRQNLERKVKHNDW